MWNEYVELESLAGQMRAGLPLTKEARIFYLDGQPLIMLDYWPDGDYGEARPPLEEFTKIASAITSRFFTMDVALRTTGEWIIVELGDGQVSGLPDQADVQDYYRRLSTEHLTP
jgi:ATP-grasp domain-containing protein